MVLIFYPYRPPPVIYNLDSINTIHITYSHYSTQAHGHPLTPTLFHLPLLPPPRFHDAAVISSETATPDRAGLVAVAVAVVVVETVVVDSSEVAVVDRVQEGGGGVDQAQEQEQGGEVEVHEEGSGI